MVIVEAVVGAECVSNISTYQCIVQHNTIQQQLKTLKNDLKEGPLSLRG